MSLSDQTINVGRSLFSLEPEKRWRLPKHLREISGLALTPDGRAMGHDDERAMIYEFDVETGAVAKRFAVGDPTVRGDFEGIAIDGEGVFYLIASNGSLLRFREGEDRSHVPFEAFDTGLAEHAEVEGLAFHLGQGCLVIAAKANYSGALLGALALYAWQPGSSSRARPWLTAPVYPLARAIGAPFFHPSGLEIDPWTGRLVILGGPERALVELDAEGGLLAARSLGAHHPQPEGVTILANGALLIADEGGSAHAHLARYARVHE